MTDMQELDRQIIEKMTTYACPKCGERLQAVIVDGEVMAFDCLTCEETYAFDNIYGS